MNKIFYKFCLVFTTAILITSALSAQTYTYKPYRQGVRPTKNIIVMIPDGTSIGVVSAARWYKYYNGMENSLYLDPYFCGTVSTYSSNAPIGDSAPTTSCYMTGMPQQSGNVSIYPLADPKNDLVEVDPEMAYQPLATILEASRIEKGRATGLVFTCEFPHATPADCSAHYHKRSNYKVIAPQMAFQNMDVVFGGGTDYVSDVMKKHFAENGTSYIENDINTFRNIKDGKSWALFAPAALPYDLDRDPEAIPSIEEMTRKAIEVLSQNDNGFFLMVEGSKVDWTAHANDAIGCITEFIAFDNAVGAALEFAKQDGNTTVIILPDHGNSGFTIGRRDLRGYDKASIDKLFGAVSKYKVTAEGLEKKLLKVQPDQIRGIIKKYTDIDITDEEYETLINSKNYKPENYMKIGENPNMQATLVQIMNARTYFGFTTGGHTGEEVFIAAYHPQGDVPVGMTRNYEFNHYLQDVSGLQTKLPELTKKIFAKHTDVLDGWKIEIDKTDEIHPVLKAKRGKNTLEVTAFTSKAVLNKKNIDLKSVVVYIEENNTFYLPENIVNF